MRSGLRYVAWLLVAVLFVGVACAAQRAEAGAEIEIILDDAGSSASGAGVEIDGGTVAIRAAGVYRVRGALSDGQLLVKVNKDAHVTLILDGAEIANAAEAAILVEDAGSVTIELAEGSENTVRSGESAELPADGADPDATGGAIHAKDDLTIAGAGALTVLGYVNNGIHCTNRLHIAGGEIRVEAANNGVKGKDGVTVSGGRLDVRCCGDGIEADSEDGAGFGGIELAGGEVSIESAGDGVQAATELTVSGGALSIVSGGGSAAAEPKQSERMGRGSGWDRDDEEDAPSAKGLKAGETLTICGGAISIDVADDALHSDGELTVSGGEVRLATGDDGAHADDGLTVSGGAVEIAASYEGIEANRILISGGDIDVTAEDDGVNANGGESLGGWGFGMRGGFGRGMRGGNGAGEMPGANGAGEVPGGNGMPGEGEVPGMGEMPGEGEMPGADGAGEVPGGNEMPGEGEMPGMGEMPSGNGMDGMPGGPRMDGAEQPGAVAGEIPEMPGEETEEDAEPLPSLRITGGTLHVNAEGDGLDSNGDLIIEGGEIVVDGPSRSGNGALDSGAESGGTCRVDGGTVLAIGASGMAEGFDGTSVQPSLRHDFAEMIPAGAEITVADADGNVLFVHTAAKSFSSMVFSCPELALGESYVLTAGEEQVEAELTEIATESGEQTRWGR